MKKKLLTLIASVAIGISAFAAATPQFPGGKEALDNYITTNLKYPERPLNQGIEGVVKVEFTVNTDGSIGSIKIVRLVDPDLEAEAIRLVKSMPAWIPADQGPATATVEIPFLIPNEQ
ncbi:MAG: TonB family protein [Bacteroides sp.]|nr:TonB family protein [Bacteroides sp.]